MQFFTLIVLSFFTVVLSTDWYICYIKDECVAPKSAIIKTAQAMPKPIVVKSKEIVEIIKGRVHFRVGAKKILKSKKLQSYLKGVAKKWKKNPKQKITLIGHTDSKGSKKLNYKLGLYRSLAIKKALTRYGVKKSKIIAKSLGESKPLSSNRTRKGRFLNRRVEINF